MGLCGAVLRFGFRLGFYAVFWVMVWFVVVKCFMWLCMGFACVVMWFVGLGGFGFAGWAVLGLFIVLVWVAWFRVFVGWRNMVCCRCWFQFGFLGGLSGVWCVFVGLRVFGLCGCLRVLFVWCCGFAFGVVLVMVVDGGLGWFVDLCIL